MRRTVHGRVVLSEWFGRRSGGVLLCRSRSSGSSGYGNLLLLEEVLQHSTYVSVLWPRILAGEGNGWLVQNLREGQARSSGVNLAFVLFVGVCFIHGHTGHLRPAEHGSGEGRAMRAP